MRILELIRLETGPAGTFGVLKIDKRIFCCTLEPPKRENRANVSCIPTGQYEIARVQSPRFGDTFEALDVPGRTDILFHKGNVVDDTQGCIVLGNSFGAIEGRRAVHNSGLTFDDFKRQILSGGPGQLAHLTITEVF